MTRRYKNLTKDYVFSALNKLRAVFLAAKDGNQVEEIIKGSLTYDERMKIGRRFGIAEMLDLGYMYREIAEELKVGVSTISFVDTMKREHPMCYELAKLRGERVEKEYKRRAYKKVGGSKLILKKENILVLKERMSEGNSVLVLQCSSSLKY